MCGTGCSPEPEDAAALGHRIRSHRGDFLLNKRTLDVFSNANVPVLLEALAPEAIVIYGVATDFCDRYTVEGLLRRRRAVELFLVTGAIRAIHPDEGTRLQRCDPRHSDRFSTPYLAVLVGVRPNGTMRDARDSPELPAPWPGEPSAPLLSLFIPSHTPSPIISRERAFVPVPPTFFRLFRLLHVSLGPPHASEGSKFETTSRLERHRAAGRPRGDSLHTPGHPGFTAAQPLVGHRASRRELPGGRRARAADTVLSGVYSCRS